MSRRVSSDSDALGRAGRRRRRRPSGATMGAGGWAAAVGGRERRPVAVTGPRASDVAARDDPEVAGGRAERRCVGPPTPMIRARPSVPLIAARPAGRTRCRPRWSGLRRGCRCQGSTVASPLTVSIAYGPSPSNRPVTRRSPDVVVACSSPSDSARRSRSPDTVRALTDRRARPRRSGCRQTWPRWSSEPRTSARTRSPEARSIALVAVRALDVDVRAGAFDDDGRPGRDLELEVLDAPSATPLTSGRSQGTRCRRTSRPLRDGWSGCARRARSRDRRATAPSVGADRGHRRRHAAEADVAVVQAEDDEAVRPDHGGSGGWSAVCGGHRDPSRGRGWRRPPPRR